MALVPLQARRVGGGFWGSLVGLLFLAIIDGSRTPPAAQRKKESRYIPGDACGRSLLGVICSICCGRPCRNSATVHRKPFALHMELP
jgi:hypothetical protein